MGCHHYVETTNCAHGSRLRVVFVFPQAGGCSFLSIVGCRSGSEESLPNWRRLLVTAGVVTIGIPETQYNQGLLRKLLRLLRRSGDYRVVV
jgi:hypothetical protein